MAVIEVMHELNHQYPTEWIREYDRFQAKANQALEAEEGIV